MSSGCLINRKLGGITPASSANASSPSVNSIEEVTIVSGTSAPSMTGTKRTAGEMEDCALCKAVGKRIAKREKFTSSMVMAKKYMSCEDCKAKGRVFDMAAQSTVQTTTFNSKKCVRKLGVLDPDLHGDIPKAQAFIKEKSSSIEDRIQALLAQGPRLKEGLSVHDDDLEKCELRAKELRRQKSLAEKCYNDWQKAVVDMKEELAETKKVSRTLGQILGGTF